MQQLLDDLLGLVEQRRPDQAIDLVRRAIAEGVEPDAVIDALLTPVQLEVGRRWEVGEWSVAQEHAATGVVTAALGVVSTAIRVPSPPRGEVIVACVEQEWHSLPARLLNERLRLRGWETVFLGAATGARELHEQAESSDAHAVVASCQMGMSLVGLSRAIEAIHSAGLPVVAGGAALGQDALRATNLGADAWTRDVDELDRILSTWVDEPVEQLPDRVDDDGEHLRVLAAGPTLVAGLRERLPADWAAQPADLNNLVGFLAGAVVSDDSRVFGDYACWLEGLLVARGGDPAQVLEVVGWTSDLLPDELTRSHAVVREAAERMSAPRQGA